MIEDQYYFFWIFLLQVAFLISVGPLVGCFTWNTLLSSVGSILGFFVTGVVLENCGLSFCALTLAQLVSSVENCLWEESLRSCNSSLPMPLPAWDQQMEGTFRGKNKKNPAVVEAVSFAFCCFPKLKGYYLYIMPYLGEPSPSAWMWNQNAVVQRDLLTLFTSVWLQERGN